MLVIVKFSNGMKEVFRTTKRDNIVKVAKSIHKYFPESDYPKLEGVIFNAFQRGDKELVLNDSPPVA